MPIRNSPQSGSQALGMCGQLSRSPWIMIIAVKKTSMLLQPTAAKMVTQPYTP